MDKSTFRNINIISALIIITSLTLVLFHLTEESTPLFILILLFALLAIIASISIKFKEKIWLRRTVKYTSIFLPFFILGGALWGYFYATDNTNIMIPIIALLFFLILSLIHFYLYSDLTSSFGSFVFILLLIIGIIFKRNHWFFGGWILFIGSAALGVGNLMFGIRYVLEENKIKYLKNLCLIGGLILAFAYSGQLFKLQHWPGAGPLVIIALVSLILGSFYVLLTLHSSGFADWQPLYKKIFIKLLIPWIFILFLYLSRYMIPELNALIWTKSDYIKKAEITNGFDMNDYTIENKNGLEAE